MSGDWLHVRRDRPWSRPCLLSQRTLAAFDERDRAERRAHVIRVALIILIAVSASASVVAGAIAH